MKPSPTKYRVAAIATLTIVTFGTAALAQNAMPAAPQDDNANSNAAMADSVRDPRIADQQPGRSWGMWDIGRPHPLQGKGAFADHDPIGVATGKLIPTDCSVHWTNPDTQQIFCFASQASLSYFLSAPQANTARAEKAWHALKGAS